MVCKLALRNEFRGTFTHFSIHCLHGTVKEVVAECTVGVTKTLHKGATIYYPPVLEAKLVTANGFAFSLMTEFIENTDLTADKQNLEVN